MNDELNNTTPEGMPDNIVDFPQAASDQIHEDVAVPDENLPVPTEAPATEDAIAFGVHVMMLRDGQFGIQATGTPNLGEMAMVLRRACTEVEARITAETVAQVMKEERRKPGIITPSGLPA